MYQSDRELGMAMCRRHIYVYVYARIYIYIYIHSIYTSDTPYIHVCTKVIRCRALQACIHEYEFTLHMYAYTDSRFSNRQDMQRLLIKALLCIEKFAAKKKIVYLIATWNGQICV